MVEDMTEQTSQAAGTATGESVRGALDQETSKRERRALLLLSAGARRFCVFADEAHRAVAWREPTPLPRAPQAVLGVVSIRGRMFTLLDALGLLPEEPVASGEHAPSVHPSYTFIVPLRGDEQLALASSSEPRAIEVHRDRIETPSGREANSKAARGFIRDEDQKPIVLLNLQEIFNLAMQGGERRRRRH
jgi:chemotaxis signal transduction protein